MKIGVACGGTGGHIFPGLATAETLEQRGHTVVLWLAGKPGEAMALAGWHGSVVTVYARSLSSKSPVEFVKTGWRMLMAVRQCLRTLRGHRPDVLLAMGSYASVAPVLAARLLNIPVVIHEANVIPGRAVRFLSRWATVVAVGFDETRRHLSHPKLVVTGMPVRKTGRRVTDDGQQIPLSAGQAQDLPRCRREPGYGLDSAAGGSKIGNQKSEIENWPNLVPDRFTLLVMGGSHGAHRLNEVVSRVILRLHGEGKPLQVIHLTGRADEASIRQVYRQSGVPHAVFGFLHDMSRAYRMAALAICRSGSSTCAELSVYGVPALLVPYPFAIHQHQAANADALSLAGAADICDEQILTVDWLTGYVAGLMRDPVRLAHMRAAALRRVTNDPASALADLVEEVGGGKADGRK